MIFHRLKKVKNGKKVEYKIDLIERHFFSEKKLAEVMADINEEKQGNELVKILDCGFSSGIKVAENKLGQEIKL